MFLGSIMMGIGPFFVGPDKFFTGIDKNIWVTSFGLGVTGFAGAYLYILSCPTLNDFLLVKFPKKPI